MFLKNISNFIFNYDYKHGSSETIKAIKVAFLDYFGVTYRGFNEDPSRIAFLSINELYNGSSTLTASIIGEGDNRQDMINAAFVNGVSAHSLDLDDGHRKAHIHLGAIVFSTALAIGEAYNVSGKDFLEASIVGYEIGILLGELVNPQHRNKGFHSTGTVGTFVAGAVAAKLLKLNENQITNALGLCGTQAAGLLESDHSGSMGKSLHVGKAVYNGILSVFLAKNGFTGSETVLDGEEGFLKTMAYSGLGEDYTLEEVFSKVGEVEVKEIYFKKYPVCRHLHSSIEAILKLRNIINKEYDHIESIFVKTYEIAASHDNYNPKTLEDLKQSLPYALAIALVCGNVTLDNLKSLISHGLLNDESDSETVNLIKKIANKVVISIDPQFEELYPDQRPSNVIIRLDENFRNGIFQNIVSIPKGDIENPFKLSEIVSKFKELNPKYDVGKLSLIDNIEDYHMAEFVQILNGDK
ncbi:MmgE/PrpD family protein [uncultured Methanobrevibacter sp.]|uniref:MmgE/PrpD family protein n=1 Tax=uncultured Methanobrevibacter sp. TaxID=253161 RepID=UPI0026DFFA25|nr:MmgE/PrpD family protein [uncultured Methanobrevibacter sp.]